MGYCELTDFTNPPPETQGLIDRASDLIDYMTLYRIKTDDTTIDLAQKFFDSQTGYTIVDDAMDRVKKACIAQVNHWLSVGEDLDDFDGINAISMGSFSVSFAGGSGKMSPISPVAYRLLLTTGLLYRGVRTR